MERIEMNTNRTGQIIPGVILILIGLAFLAVQVIPGLAEVIRIGQLWPLIIVGAGLVFFSVAIFTKDYEAAIPGSIITGVGALLFYQNLTGDWASWAYAWTLIPGFVGIGILITGLLSPGRPEKFRAGGTLILISAVMFVIFGAFLGPINLGGFLLPAVLILAGLILLGGALFRRA